jgi:hypothetical protein
VTAKRTATPKGRVVGRRTGKPAKRRRDPRAATERWLEHGDEVTALFECALRGCLLGDRDVAEQSVYELMRALDSQGRVAGNRVLGHFDTCLTELAQGDFEDAFEALSTLRDHWVEALDALRRDCQRADRLH